MNAIVVVSALAFGLAVGFLLGHAFAVWSRRRFIHSLMPATDEHTDFDEIDVPAPWDHDQRAGYHVLDTRLDLVRRGAVDRAVHEEGIGR